VFSWFAALAWLCVVLHGSFAAVNKTNQPFKYIFMKKFFSIITIAIAIAIVSFSCTNKQIAAVQTVSKTINMAVFTDNNYTSKIYDVATAGLTVTVKKVNKNKAETVFEKSFPVLALKFFPAAINPFKEAIQIPAVNANDVLQVSYTLTYNANGSVMQMESNEVVTGKEDGQLEINI
jgi:hypothetical protein